MLCPIRPTKSERSRNNMIYIISQYEREREMLRLAVEERKAAYELKAFFNYHHAALMQDGDIIVGKLPLNLLFAIKADIEMYVQYSKKNGGKGTNYYHYLLQQVEVDGKSCPAYILLGSVEELGF